MKMVYRPVMAAILISIGLLGLSIVVGNNVHVSVPILSLVLVVLLAFDAWMLVVTFRGHRRASNLDLLSWQVEASVTRLIAAAVSVAIGTWYTIAHHIPQFLSFFGLALVTLLLSVPAAFFLWAYYRGKL